MASDSADAAVEITDGCVRGSDVGCADPSDAFARASCDVAGTNGGGGADTEVERRTTSAAGIVNGADATDTPCSVGDCGPAAKANALGADGGSGCDAFVTAKDENGIRTANCVARDDAGRGTGDGTSDGTAGASEDPAGGATVRKNGAADGASGAASFGLAVRIWDACESLITPQRFTLCSGLKSVIKIGRTADCDVQLVYRGVSGVHAELRLLQAGGGKLLVRDLSTNGTGMKRPGDTSSELPSCLVKDSDFSVPDGSMLLVPMRLKADMDQAKIPRAWLKVHYETLSGQELVDAIASAAAEAKAAKDAAEAAAAAIAQARKDAKGARRQARLDAEAASDGEDSDEAAIAAEVAGAEARASAAAVAAKSAATEPSATTALAIVPHGGFFPVGGLGVPLRGMVHNCNAGGLLQLPSHPVAPEVQKNGKKSKGKKEKADKRRRRSHKRSRSRSRSRSGRGGSGSRSRSRSRRKRGKRKGRQSGSSSGSRRSRSRSNSRRRKKRKDKKKQRRRRSSSGGVHKAGTSEQARGSSGGGALGVAGHQGNVMPPPSGHPWNMMHAAPPHPWGLMPSAWGVPGVLPHGMLPSHVGGGPSAIGVPTALGVPQSMGVPSPLGMPLPQMQVGGVCSAAGTVVAGGAHMPAGIASHRR
eukprot:TRINITY_DN31137_c0_g1_i1.p1 TRINITY_DN31137_c0_g1~~TRINITY_DN31137_c0_g1_i1.p1  ORF type:complete len:647 (+),score=141.81 TRINITY_DN31137_c0_g1_i1:228-2168(+)